MSPLATGPGHYVKAAGPVERGPSVLVRAIASGHLREHLRTQGHGIGSAGLLDGKARCGNRRAQGRFQILSFGKRGSQNAAETVARAQIGRAHV